MLFAMEVILGSFAIRHLNAVVIASVGAAVTSHILLGDEQFLTTPAHALGTPSELILYVGLAGIAVAFGLLYLRALDLGARYRLPAAFPGWMFPVVAGLIVGAIGLVAPNSLGTGHRYLSELLALEDSGGFVWYALGALALAKIVTSVFTRSGGGSAGTFMPSLFIGGAVGAGFAILIDPIWGGSDLKPGAFAIVGMAAVFATIARAPMTSVIIMFELTGNYELVLPLMLAAALATYAGERIHPANAYTIPLKRKGITLPKNEDIDLLDTVFVSTVMQPLDGALRPWTTLAEAAEFFDTSTHHGAAVLSDRDQLVGILTLADIARAGGPSLSVTVSAAMSGDVITVTPDVPVSIALTRMASLGVGRLPVVSETDPRHVVGMFRRESVVKAYESALSMSKGRELYRERKRIRTQPGADFFEATVREGSPIANALVSEVAWPEHSVLVSIRRGTNVLVPHGKTSIRVGDVITSFGSPTANRGFSKLTEPGPSGDLE
jgi:CIC family chloride channel protein